MKGVLLLLLVLAGVWLWRSRTSSVGQRPSPPSVEPPPTLDTVACSRCTVHIPRIEAVQGKYGVYCCLEHLHQTEP
ncbi:PP0621 family protein [Rhodoferax sp.]|uniref:PP0621 family protein n=1 Tax=Rhodoferax sp. TaxID=50421 RepID=UPI0026306027|nr:PP0621 family protein [Rhodoferax sp.]MDD2919767.1 PP0621 family protein [Rhodoferax sp.]